MKFPLDIGEDSNYKHKLMEITKLRDCCLLVCAKGFQIQSNIKLSQTPFLSGHREVFSAPQKNFYKMPTGFGQSGATPGR